MASETLVPGLVAPKFLRLAYDNSSAPVCFAIAEAVSGRKGCRRDVIYLIASIRLYITVFRVSFPSSVFASIHGVVSSMYLLERSTIFQIWSRLSETLSVSIVLTIFSLHSMQVFESELSKSVLLPGAGIIPSKYLFTIDTVLFTRLPSVLARSELYLFINIS